jgi:hypothetical protein
MNYLAKIIYQVLGGNVQFEEYMMPIKATDNYDAYIQAIHFGSNTQKKIEHANGTILKWHFINVVDIKPQLNNEYNYGYANRIEPTNAQKYLLQTMQKANSLEANYSY